MEQNQIDPSVSKSKSIVPKEFILGIIIVVIILFGIFLVVLFLGSSKEEKTTNDSISNEVSEYSPVINPDDFTTDITNPYFTLPVGRKLIYEAQTDEGTERVEIQVTTKTKEIMGVKTIVYWDRVWLDSELIEDTRDYLAQDNVGNVWYFGEDVDNYEKGKLIDHEGSWLAGVDEAQPGIWIKGEHSVEDSYRQEYYKGVAEDMRDVISINETVTIGLGTYSNCLKMYDWTPLDSQAKEYKYYCKELGALVMEENVGSDERLELIEADPLP